MTARYPVKEFDDRLKRRHTAQLGLLGVGPVNCAGQAHDAINVAARIPTQGDFQRAVVAGGRLRLGQIAAYFDGLAKPPEKRGKPSGNPP